jgi:putative membrane protein
MQALLAFAHSSGAASGPQDLLHHWSFDPFVWVPLLLAHILYVWGVFRAWARAGVNRIIHLWRAVCFMAGELVLVVALISPLDPLGETLLSAHMAQHILLAAVAPPLLALGYPVLAWTWAFPQHWRRIGATAPVRAFVNAIDVLTRPVTATVASAFVLWFWHAPALFESALEVEWIHTLEHASFFFTSLLLWQAALARRTSPVAASIVILVTFIVSGMLGGLLLLAPTPVYGWYGDLALLWDLTPLQDQQLAGLAMWVPAGGVYLLAFAVFALRAAAGPRSAGSGRGPSHGIMRASTSSRSMK